MPRVSPLIRSTAGMGTQVSYPVIHPLPPPAAQSCPTIHRLIISGHCAASELTPAGRGRDLHASCCLGESLGAAAAAGISVSSWAVKAESPADLGPSPLPPLFPVSVFSSVLPCLFSHDPVDISLLRFSSFISLLSFPSRVTHWKMSGSPEVSGIF